MKKSATVAIENAKPRNAIGSSLLAAIKKKAQANKEHESPEPKSNLTQRIDTFTLN